jgi:death-on-curing protein
VKRWRWVRLDVAHAIHDRQLAEHGGLSGAVDVRRLEAALAPPKNLFAYGKPDAADLAAAYAYRIVRNHPFADGNKRTAWVIVRLFLSDNGHTLQYDPTEAVKIVEAAAAGTVKEAQLAAWFRERISRSK